jgi:hypothetical protein
MQHFYKPLSGFFKFKTVYDIMLNTIPDNGVWVEIGAWQGKSISYAVVESINLHKKINFSVIDIWETKQTEPSLILQENLYQNFLKNIDPIKDHVNVIIDYSWSAASKFKESSVDCVMIDADHSYSSVKKDIEAWWPKIKKDGIIAGDDLIPKFPGVKEAVLEFTQNHKILYEVIDNAWIIKK